jgi:hypothetical protein
MPKIMGKKFYLGPEFGTLFNKKWITIFELLQSATKCNETVGKWSKNKHGASKIIDTFETYHHVTPINIQEVQASKLGDAPRHPFFIGKNQVIFQDTVFLLLRILCIFFLERLYFRLQFSFVLFAAING